ncbi:hypothetical protein [Modestobacter altitudinis]|uniref:hypothetical protein n=1 Tax=Modestobacter altitudinis TaxID=2213158 RepID=UPI0015D1CE7B|nr:hypothetical protein [Modestobacter altitudinis]
MSTPGAGGPQPPEQDPSEAGRSAGWGQQPSADSPAGWGQQPPTGASTPGQQPWGPPQPGQLQPGQPQQFGQPQAFGQPGGAQAFGEPPKRSSKLLPILGGVVALVVALGLLFSFLGAGDPEVGDCVKPDGSSFETVACDDDEAQAKIVGTDTEMTGDAFDAADVNDLCTEVPSATAVLWWGTSNDEDGKVYCAESL